MGPERWRAHSACSIFTPTISAVALDAGCSAILGAEGDQRIERGRVTMMRHAPPLAKPVPAPAWAAQCREERALSSISRHPPAVEAGPPGLVATAMSLSRIFGQGSWAASLDYKSFAPIQSPR